MAQNLKQRPQVALAVDLAILTVRDSKLQILLVERANEPYRGQLALPGGFIDTADEDLDTAAARELAEETGLAAERLHLEQLRAYGSPGRDPRGRVVTVCYLALMPDLPIPVAGGDARAARWEPVDAVLADGDRLAFDHRVLIADAVERAQGKLENTTLGVAFCPPEFTISELRRVYEIVWRQELDPRNFHRKATSVDGFLEPTGRRTTRGGRPAALYRRGPARVLHPPLLRGHNHSDPGQDKGDGR
ncbi:NUDIX domain-containing protein [Amycolatopsis sp. NPDC051128]|uniref:NUDIX hydrolase n=1 Tax=Amycolatopsis sp. NPDC051128 TaxID=3155412 RepID=UPI003413E2C7